MTTAQYPRSPKEQVGGLCHIGRLIDKIHMRNAGLIPEAVIGPIPVMTTRRGPSLSRPVPLLPPVTRPPSPGFVSSPPGTPLPAFGPRCG